MYIQEITMESDENVTGPNNYFQITTSAATSTLSQPTFKTEEISSAFSKTMKPRFEWSNQRFEQFATIAKERKY